MVDIKKIPKAVRLFEKFFEEINENLQNVGDVERVIYGLMKVKFLWEVIRKYEKEPKNQLLKQIDASFMYLTRGIEFFEDFETNKKFYKLSESIPEIKSYIKW